MGSLLIKNIKKLISCAADDKLYDRVNIFCEDGLITDISKDIHQADETIDATDMLCFPGFINTHHHLYQIFTRNLPQTQTTELIEWL